MQQKLVILQLITIAICEAMEQAACRALPSQGDMMRISNTLLLILATSQIIGLGGCSSYEISSKGNHIPYVDLAGNELAKYQKDAVTCNEKVRASYGDGYAYQNDIRDVRACLVQKGYVLLS